MGLTTAVFAQGHIEISILGQITLTWGFVTLYFPTITAFLEVLDGRAGLMSAQ